MQDRMTNYEKAAVFHVLVCLHTWLALHILLLLGDVPDGTTAGTGTRGRENRHAQDTNIISITD